MKKLSFVQFCLTFVSFVFIVGGLRAAIPLPIPIIGGKMPKGMSALMGSAKDALANADVTMAIIQIFLLLVIIVGIWGAFFRLHRFLYFSKLKKLGFLMSQLKMELILRVAAPSLSGNKNIERGESLKEIVHFIEEMVQEKFLFKRIGERCQKRILEGLQAIRRNKIDFDKQTALINSWLEMLKGF